MTESRQPGQGWSSGSGGDAWSAATYTQPPAELDPPAASGDAAQGPTLQGFGDVTPGYGEVDFGSDSQEVAVNTGWPVTNAQAHTRHDLAPAGWVDTSTTNGASGTGLVSAPWPSGPAPIGSGSSGPAPIGSVPPGAAPIGSRPTSPFGGAQSGGSVTCPECGTRASVVLNRRESRDFCAVCDYPLFWTPSVVHRDHSSTDESLRRLPGTVGRATVASLPCPHCSEPNALSAQVCIRCGRSLHPVAVVPPPPAPVPARPAPVAEPEPDRGTPWWLWVLIGVAVVAIVVLLVLGATHVIG